LHVNSFGLSPNSSD